ncbi:MAG TPA: AAA family ATPase [Pseudonocardiaceae bacterium]|nr:AAA family ATPase [Pseudonocardiaceae bacterium]
MAGASGSGKTTLRRAIGEALGMPTVELDSMYHGPGWTPIPTFVSDVERFAAGHEWVVEWQYRRVRPMLADRADLLVWLDHGRWTVLWRVTRRTVVRRLRRQELWNGNLEPPLWTIFTDPDHIIRWSWRTWRKAAVEVGELKRPPVVRLRGQRQVNAWLTGPVAEAAWQRQANRT